MAKTVYVFLAHGFEELEAVATIDVLRRAGLTTITVAVGDSLQVAGAHNIPMIADIPLSDVRVDVADAVVLPGGLPGVDNLNASAPLRAMIQQAHDSGKLVAAICAAPLILGQLGLLEGREATCYPSFEEHLRGYKPTERQVVASGNVITAMSAGVAVDFGLAIASYLVGEEAAASVAKAIIYNR